MKFLRTPLAPLLAAGKRYLHKNSMIGRETIDSPGSWKILDRLYGNEPGKMDSGKFVPKHWTDRMFYHSRAAKATRTRFSEYMGKMRALGERYAAENKGRLRILSLASGPGRDVIEAAESLRGKGVTTSALCVDRCEEAVELGSALAARSGLQSIAFRKCRIAETRRFENDGPYDIVITQGILDYLGDEKAIELLQTAREISREGGTLITSNMGRHVWMRLWMEIFGEWRLKYRNGKDLADLLIASGYDCRKISVYPLPEGYHWMGIGKK